MKTLQECNWKAYQIKDLFEVETGANVNKNKLTIGVIPRITATDTNNGVDWYTEHIQDKGFRIYTNRVSISFLGSCFYQPYQASYDMKIHNISIRDRAWNQYTALFVASQCKRFCEHVNYGNQLSSSDLPKQHILLPITPDNTPDWQFMEDYMREVESKLLAQAQPALQEKVNKYANRQLPTLNSRNWKEFAIKDIFNIIQRGKRLKTDDHILGNMPYVSSTAMDNGVDNFIGNTNGVRIFSNCLTIANSGSVGSTFYHPYSFIASDHVTKLKSPQISKYAYLFIATTVAILGEKYSFNREINDKRISREHIILPVTPDNTPDWQFMEDYMRAVEAKQIAVYLQQKHLT